MFCGQKNLEGGLEPVSALFFWRKGVRSGLSDQLHEPGPDGCGARKLLIWQLSYRAGRNIYHHARRSSPGVTSGKRPRVQSNCTESLTTGRAR